MLRRIMWGFFAAAVSLLFSPATVAATTSDISLTIADTVLVVDGLAPPNTLVEIALDGATAGSIVSAADGSYSLTISSQTPGITNVDTTYTYAGGVQYTLPQTEISLAAQQVTTVTQYAPPTLQLTPTADVTRGSFVQAFGFSVPGSTVTVRLDGTGRLFSAIADDNGFYSVLINTDDLQLLGYDVSAFATFSGSTTSPFSAISSFTVVDNSVPTPDIVVGRDLLPPPIALFPESGATITGDTVTITGESLPGAQIVAYANGERVGSVTADSSGRWSFPYTAFTTPVVLTFEACINQRCSVLSATLTINFVNTLLLADLAGCGEQFELERYRFWGVPARSLVALQLRTGEGGVFMIDWGDDTQERFHDDTERRFEHRYDRSGVYNGYIERVTDDNCQYRRYFSIVVEPSTNVQTSTRTLWIVLLVTSFIAAVVYKKHYQTIEK